MRCESRIMNIDIEDVQDDDRTGVEEGDVRASREIVMVSGASRKRVGHGDDGRRKKYCCGPLRVLLLETETEWKWILKLENVADHLSAPAM